MTLSNCAIHTLHTGCHVVAPSDMMDNRIAAIKKGLLDAGLRNVSGFAVYYICVKI